MFDIGFSELLLVFIIGLVVLGPQRLPVAVKTVMGWIRAMRSLASSVQHELSQELKLQELQDSLRKVEQASKASLSPELKASMDELKSAADELKRGYRSDDEKADDEAHTLHHPQPEASSAAQTSVTPARADRQSSASAQVPDAVQVRTQPAESRVDAAPTSPLPPRDSAATDVVPVPSSTSDKT
ncbi:Sec-independent protein translocase protein TatB [Pantoea sp. 1.19]|uniref:Sec-independent protein translocase protein TatB n=1 Tax=Pantoea sp. 1.19 TaxID=1925589 RepID=UPI000948B6AF|nr:Sec-independent protein translocase protein TatB [Pantoea sp. 1.19]